MDDASSTHFKKQKKRVEMSSLIFNGPDMLGHTGPLTFFLNVFNLDLNHIKLFYLKLIRYIILINS